MQPKKSLSEAYQSFFQNLFNFNGRSRRSDYWPVVIINSIVVSIVSGAITGALGADSVAGNVISYALSLALFVLELGLVVRRLHDTGKEWTYILLSLIPVVGWIIVLIALLKDSDPGDNKFGPNPKAIYADPAQAYQQPAQPYQPQPVAPPQPPIQPAQPVQQPYQPAQPVQPVEPVQPVQPEPTTYYQPPVEETTTVQPEE